MSELVFRDEDHTYWLDGQEIPSVSQVLQDMGFSGSPWYTEDAAAKGRTIHLLTILLDGGMTAEEAINRIGLHIYDGPGYEIEGYVRDYAAFREKHPSFKWFQIEEPCANEVLRYGATQDRIGLDEENKPCVLDIKSGQKAKWHRIQLAAYDFDKSLRRYALYLTDTPGKFSLVRFEDPTDYTAWEYAVWLWWWQRGNL